MKARKIVIGLFVGLLLSLLGCETRQSVETEMQLVELEAQVAELEAQIDYAYTQMTQLSRELSEAVRAMEASLEDVNRRVLDLPAGDPQIAIREVEAAMAVANQRMEAVRVATNNFATSLEF